MVPVIISGFIFIVIGLLESRNLKSLYKEKKGIGIGSQNTEDEQLSENSSENTTKSKFAELKSNPYLAGFFAIFIMELGDKINF